MNVVIHVSWSPFEEGVWIICVASGKFKANFLKDHDVPASNDNSLSATPTYFALEVIKKKE